MQKSQRISLYKIILFVLLALYTISLFVPMLWGLMTSLKSEDDAFYNILSLPEKWEFGNYAYVIKNFVVSVTSGAGKLFTIGLLPMLFNTFMYSIIGAVISTFVPFMTAYLCAKFSNPTSKAVYVIVIVTMILPIVGSYPSQIRLLHSIGLYDTFAGDFLMKASFRGMYFLVFYSVFKNLDKGYAEAAYLDGASEMRVMVNIYFPLAVKMFFTVALLHFIAYWNDYQTPLLFLPGHPTLAYGVYKKSMSGVGSFSTVPFRLAAAFLMIIPILAIFVAFRNRIMGNVSMGGIKG